MNVLAPVRQEYDVDADRVHLKGSPDAGGYFFDQKHADTWRPRHGGRRLLVSLSE
jgi:hypothetical protein